MEDLVPLAVFSAFLLLAAIVLLISHVRAWRTFQRDALDAAERDYRRNQFHRRMVTSSTLAVLAIVMFAGHVAAFAYRSQLFAVILWGAILLVLFAITLLAVIDMGATHRHFSRIRRESFIERAQLQAELRRIHAANGQAQGSGDGNRGNENGSDGAHGIAPPDPEDTN